MASIGTVSASITDAKRNRHPGVPDEALRRKYSVHGLTFSAEDEKRLAVGADAATSAFCDQLKGRIAHMIVENDAGPANGEPSVINAQLDGLADYVRQAILTAMVGKGFALSFAPFAGEEPVKGETGLDW